MSSCMQVIPDRVYGSIEVPGQVYDLTQSLPFQRLSNVSQGGYVFLSNPQVKTTRFEHSLGVYHLIKILNGSLVEQVAGLLHDISHTAFSHVIDYVLDNGDEDYHEQIRSQFLEDPFLYLSLKNMGISLANLEREDDFNLLEQPLPLLCADRIDYTLRDLLAWQKIDHNQIHDFLSALENIEGQIVINKKEAAIWFRDSYSLLNEEIYKAPKNLYAAQSLTQILRLGLESGVLNLGDFHRDDLSVLEKIKNSNLKDQFNKISEDIERKNFKINSVQNIKERKVDPLVKSGSQVVPLSKLV